MCIWRPRWGDPSRISTRPLVSENYSPWVIVWRCLHDPTFIRFHTMPARVGQTDRRTDTRRQHIPR